MKNWEIIASLLEREEHALGSVVEYMIHGYQSVSYTHLTLPTT